MELLEKIKKAIDKITGGECPFCKSKKEKAEKVKWTYTEDTCEDTRSSDEADDGNYTLHNDSGKLAKVLGKGHFKPIKNILASKTYYIYENYWIEPGEKSEVCGNAHHIIPGNASLAKCTAILKWMAGTVVVKRVRYSKPKKEATVKKKTYTDEEGVKVSKSWSRTDKGNQKLETIKEIEGKVTGYVDWDLNGLNNGIWLPSNNSIYKWKNNDWEFKRDFANAAMNSTKKPRQFHDCHCEYSSKILDMLCEIAKDLDKRSQACDAADHKCKDKDELFPVPEQLKKSLIEMASEIKKKLEGDPNEWKIPWLTSKMSAKFKSVK